MPNNLFRHMRAMFAILVLAGALGCNQHHGSMVSVAPGEPQTLAELDAWYPAVPEAENGAIVFGKAASAFQEAGEMAKAHLPEVGDAKLPELKAPLAGDMRAAMSDFVRKNEKAIELASRAAAMPKSRFPVDFSKGLTTILPHDAPLRNLTRAMGVAAMVSAETGDAESVFRNLRDGMRIQQLAKNEPQLISQLSRTVCDAISLRCAERALNHCALSDAQLKELQEVAAGLEDPDLYYRGLIGERCVGIDETSKLHDALGKQSSSELNRYGLSDESLRFLAQTTSKLIAVSRLPYAERRARVDAIMIELESRSFGKNSVEYTYGKAARAHDADTASVRVLACGIALKRYQTATKSLPASLDALVPKYLAKIPDDPFDGAPLRYKKSGEIATVYSVGRDGDDDNGKPFESDGTTTPDGDIIFRCVE